VRPIDLLGIPLGVITQVALVPAVYLPLRALWPNTFEAEELERRAQELADRAGGWTTVLLVVFVAIGAPVVEELVYRGMLQRAFSRRIGVIPALLSISVMFALVHPSPVEYPGLWVAGLVFGSSTARLDRIGMSWFTHAAFNATGLWFVLR
jgi:membrane protease YdiL (CAAX protease family)